MKSIKSIFFALFFLFSLTAQAQTNSGANEQTQNPDAQTSKDNETKAVFEGSSPFSLYKDSYGLFGYSNSALNKQIVFKLQISVKFKLPVSGIYLAYTQRSFMDLLQESAPFIDHYYEPELYYIYSFSDEYAESHWLQSLQIGYRHSSNGEQEVVSQSWDRIYIDGVFQKNDWYIRTSVWYPIATDVSNDVKVTDYWGYGELQLAHVWDNNMRISAILRKGMDFKKGSVRIDYSVPFTSLFKNMPEGWEQSNLWCQLFQGHGETFIGIEESSTALAIGVGFRPDFNKEK